MVLGFMGNAFFEGLVLSIGIIISKNCAIEVFALGYKINHLAGCVKIKCLNNSVIAFPLP